ncbi:PAAR/S-type pyocin domain-containing protein [Yersinia pekkanenii]|uniref:PAAR/S-type pyocin domain-containing protein n=1 Tax=Yersinia pekkanenii TaxID=1288385 RepID=A0A0T9PZ95_9GAMM|nr:PAAR/S-type pyocin domain-containing protein [Yersinia pekkanenii]CRY67814.1 PAAR/S-type pyocin domain-containing protein [Yersinia pekkanenii]
MARSLACLGDKTTHGEIRSASSTWFEGLKAVAQSGDLAWCEVCKGTFQIIGTVSDWSENQPFVATGDRVMCRCPNHVVIGMARQVVDPIVERQPQMVAAAQSAIPAAPIVKTTPAPPIPVFAKSCLRGDGCTDAGTGGEPHNNFGQMGFYQAIPPSAISSDNNNPANNNAVEQRAQSAKRKQVQAEPETKTPWYKRLLGSTSATPAAVAVPVSTGAGLAALEQAGIQGMRFVGGSLMTAGRWMVGSSPVGTAVMGMMPGTLNEGEADLLDKLKLENIARNGGTAPTRVRFRWVDAGNGRLKAEGYHVSAEGGLDKVPVRKMTLNTATGNYEFWEDGAKGPSILWTPNDPGFKAPPNTGNNDGLIIHTTITVLPMPEADETGERSTTLPMPEEKDFRDYILIHPLPDLPPLYIYLSKPPVEFLDVELYSDFKRRSRQGKYEADHMPSRASVELYYETEYPELSEKDIKALSDNVASIVIPKEIHQKVSETYGGRNKSEQIGVDARNLRAALDRNLDAIKPALKEYGATEGQIEAARAKMHKLNDSMGLYK